MSSSSALAKPLARASPIQSVSRDELRPARRLPLTLSDCPTAIVRATIGQAADLWARVCPEGSWWEVSARCLRPDWLVPTSALGRRRGAGQVFTRKD